MDPVERLAGDEALEGLDAEGELAQGERPLVAEAPGAEPAEVGLGGVLGPVDDAEVLAAAARDAGLGEALRATVDDEAAHRLGLVHRVVESGAAVDEAVDWARWLASHPDGALTTTKQSIHSVRDVPVKDALGRELDAYIRSFSEADALERARTAQAAYDHGATSAEVFGIESSSIEERALER